MDLNIVEIESISIVLYDGQIHMKIIYRFMIHNSYVILIFCAITPTQEYKRKHIEEKYPKSTIKINNQQSRTIIQESRKMIEVIKLKNKAIKIKSKMPIRKGLQVDL